MTPPLRLLPGWAMHAACWGELAALGETCAWPVQGGFSLETQRQCWAALPGPPAIWLGWSLGALVALALAATAPERVRGLVLVGATPRFTAAADWPWGLPEARLGTFAQALSAAPEAALAEFLRWVTQPSSTARRALQKHWAQSPPPAHEALHAGLQILADTDLRPRLAAVTCPCLIIHGAQDAVVPPPAAAALAQALPGGTLVSLGLSHAPFLEQPRQFQATLQAWNRQC